MGLAAVIRLQAASVARRPMTWILVGVLVGYALLVVVSVVLLLAAPAQAGFDADLLLAPMRDLGLVYVAQLYLSIGQIVVVVFAASLIGSEFTRGTLRTLLLMRVRRRDVGLAGIMVVLAAAGALALLGVVFTFGAAAAFSAASGEDLLGIDGPTEAATASLSILFRGLVVLATWGLLAYLVTMLSRNLIVGIGGTLAMQVVGGFIALFLAGLGDGGRWASRLLVNAAVDRLSLPRELDLSAGDAAWVAATLLVYLGGTAWWAFHRFQRMDALAATRPG